MSQDDSLDLATAARGSRLLSEDSLDFPSSSSHGPGGADLSLSELLPSDPTPKPKVKKGPIHRRAFSLLAPRDDTTIVDDEEEAEEPEAELDHDQLQLDVPKVTDQTPAAPARTREEKLKHDRYVLRKLNSALGGYDDALKEVGSHIEGMTVRLTKTSALLGKYTSMMSRSRQLAGLILDEDFEGADADEEAMERERLEAEEQRRREEAERLLAEQRERERVEREERERQEREAREKAEQEKREKETAKGRGGSGVRGVRGTRASMRGAARGSTRGVPTPSASSASRGSTTSRRSTSTSRISPASARGSSRPSR